MVTIHFTGIVTVSEDALYDDCGNPDPMAAAVRAAEQRDPTYEILTAVAD